MLLQSNSSGMFSQRSTWHELHTAHFAFLRSLAAADSSNVQIATDRVIRMGIAVLSEICNSAPLAPEYSSLTYCMRFVNFAYGIKGFPVTDKQDDEYRKIGKTSLAMNLALYAESCGRVDLASEAALNFLSELVKVLRFEAIVFGGSTWRASNAAISRAVGAEMMTFIDHVAKVAERARAEVSFNDVLELEGVPCEIMFGRLAKVYGMKFDGFQEIFDINAEENIEKACTFHRRRMA